MKNLTVIEGSRPLLPQARVDAAGKSISDPRPSSAPVTDSPAAPVAETDAVPDATTASAADPDAVRAIAAEMQEALDRLSGPRREVQLYFEDDGDFIVEIRRADDGQVIQRFPPENLLNLRSSVADLLGTVVDRLS